MVTPQPTRIRSGKEFWTASEDLAEESDTGMQGEEDRQVDEGSKEQINMGA